MQNRSRNIVATVLVAGVASALGMTIPTTAAAGIWDSVKSTASSVASTASSGASAVAGKVESAVPAVGDTVHDAGVELGKVVKTEGDKATTELKKNGKVVGNVVVQGGKIVATQTLTAGKAVLTEAETGPKYLVNGSKIVGQEAWHNGKVVGTTLINQGKVVGHTVVAGGEYVVKEGKIALNFISANACKALVGGISDIRKVGAVLPDFSSVVSTLNKRSGLKNAELKASQAAAPVLNKISAEVGKVADTMPELKRIAGLIKSSSKVAELFTANSLCDSTPQQLQAKLVALGLKPNLDKKYAAEDDGFFISEARAASGHFFMAYSLNASVASVYGLQTALSIVTDYRNNTGLFYTVGPQIVTNKVVGAGIGVQFFPVVEFADFPGWGFGVAVAGDIPKGKFDKGGLGLDFSFDQTFTKFQGVGMGSGAGEGKLPADVGVSATYSWKLK